MGCRSSVQKAGAGRVHIKGRTVFRQVQRRLYTACHARRGSDAIRVGGVSARDTAPITMDGRAVFRFAVEALPHCLHTVLDQTNQTLDDLDWVVCHQANSRILDHCIKQLNADPAKFYKNIDRYGNTSAASIPLALHEMSESGLLQPGQQLACIGFGGGLTWGGMLLTYKGRENETAE